MTRGIVEARAPAVGTAPGEEMYRFAADLFPICRSITGDGVRQTLRWVGAMVPSLRVREVPSGTKCFDWIVPDEWNIRDAYVADASGRRVIDFRRNNLHVVSYSTPVDTVVSRAELDEHLFSIPELPDAIPYRTSYYRPFWGFCLSHNDRQRLAEGSYRVRIDADVAPGHLTYADVVIPGSSTREVFFSTYICHPSMANNEVSGPTVATFLARWLQARKGRYTYRLCFVPETIGAVAYLHENLDHLRAVTLAGFQLTCVGDDRTFSYLPSRTGATLADRVAEHVLRHLADRYDRYDFVRDRGSDERQWSSPGADLPVVSIMRSKYGTYPEYHTSLDDMSVISAAGLAGSLFVHQQCVQVIEANRTWRTSVVGEPQLSRRGLGQPVGGSRGPLPAASKLVLDVLELADGTMDVIAIADRIGAYALDVADACLMLAEDDLLIEVGSR